MKRINTFLLSLAISFLSCMSANAQQLEASIDTIKQEVVTFESIKKKDKGDIKFYFEISSYIFDEKFSSNPEEISALDSIMKKGDVTVGLDSIVLFGTASIDGKEENNIVIAKNRSESVRTFLLNRYSQISPDIVKTQYIGEDWQGLRELVAADNNVPFKSDVLKIIDSTNRSADTREWLLKNSMNSVPWNYLKTHTFPKQRYGASVVFHYDIEKIKRVSYKDSIIVTPISAAVPVQDSIAIVEADTTKPFFALKTNLLYDLASFLNIELEIPIGDRWSVSGEWIGPWWRWDNKKVDSKRHRIETKIGVAEVRYWFGDREDKPKLTGWFGGIYGSFGTYDFEYNREGIQSKNLISGGLVGGYAHTINKKGNLRLEYELGLGYAQSTYKKYTAEFDGDNWWNAYRDHTANHNWFGPTKLEVSLVWMINRKVKADK